MCVDVKVPISVYTTGGSVIVENKDIIVQVLDVFLDFSFLYTERR